MTADRTAWMFEKYIGPDEDESSLAQKDKQGRKKCHWKETPIERHPMTCYHDHSQYVSLYAHAIPTLAAIKEIRDFFCEKSTLSVCCGKGYWESLLLVSGVDIIATDLLPDGTEYVNVEELSSKDAVSKYRTDNLFICWPDWGPSSSDALQGFGGSRIVYVGEPITQGKICIRHICDEGIVTGNDLFHRLLQTEWDCIKIIDIPHWPNHQAQVYMYTRKP